MISTKEYKNSENLKTLNVEKIILLVGAGVSILPPTSLPAGQKLTEYCLEKATDKNAATKLVEAWKKINEIIYTVNKFSSSLIRLEFIIGCMTDVDAEFYKPPFIQGFKRFANVNPNVNHYYLGQILRKGGKIITPNFDCAIERTFDNYQTVIESGIPAGKTESGIVYHYHGIGTDYEQLGTTILMIKKGIQKQFGEQLKKWFEEGYSIISVGFSCSDYFDMTPFFENMESNCYRGQAIFFQHGNSVDESTKNKIDKFYGAFEDRKILFGDTTLFLKDICEKMGQCDIDYKGREEIGWNKDFEEIMNISQRDRLFYLIRLLNQSGLNLTEEAFDQNNSNDLLYGYHNMNELLEEVMRRLDKIDVEKHIENLSDRSKSIFSDVIDLCRKNLYESKRFEKINSAFQSVTSQGGVRKAANEITYKQLIGHILGCSVSSQNFSSKYVYAYKRIAKKKIGEILKQGRIYSEDKEIEELYKCGAKMLQLPFNEYLYISYYISIKQTYDILTIMLGKEINIEENENHLINIALEICGLSLVVMIYFNTTLQYMMFFMIKQDEEYLRKAKERMRITRRCIDTIGNKKHGKEWERRNAMIHGIKEKFLKLHELDIRDLADWNMR